MKASAMKPTYVVYIGPDEVLVSTLENEEAFKEEAFGKCGRDIADYDREEVKDYVAISVQGFRVV